MFLNMTSSFRDRIRLAAQIALILTSFMALGACMSIRVQAGYKIDPLSLQEFHIGQSTPDEVEAILGKPFGRGRSYLPFQPDHLEMWSYYYEVGTKSDDRRTFLFVYFHNDVLDGYMWFSSLPETLK